MKVQICEERSLQESTIVGHLAKALKAGYPVDLYRGFFVTNFKSALKLYDNLKSLTLYFVLFLQLVMISLYMN